MVTIIPLMVTYKPEDLPFLKVQKLNRWLKDALTWSIELQQRRRDNSAVRLCHQTRKVIGGPTV